LLKFTPFLFPGKVCTLIQKSPSLGNTPSYQIARLFRYDQLNRITKAASFAYFNYTSGANQVDWTHPSNNRAFYDETFSYDANGNIRTATRNSVSSTSPTTVAQMDNFAYSYYPGTNKLRQVTDTRPATAFGSSGITAAYKDVDNQAADNYVYDAIGNLTKDNAEAISAIAWNVYGKITGITKTGGNLTYTYDAQGNRITAFNSGTGKTTCYVRDAQGNVLATYEHAGTTLRLKEMHLYGSSRLGIHNFNMPLNTMSGEPTKLVGTVTGVRRNFTRGNKLFELSNHLGNVLATIADQKTSLPNGIWVAKYQPLIVNTQDYYAFGMQAPFSEYNAGTGRYRYGFNGKENDSEVKGSGNQQDYGMRIYDTRLGRFLSVDPIMKDYPELTPYQFASNTPIFGIDLDGKELFGNNWLFDIWLEWKFGDPTGAKRFKAGAEKKIAIENGLMSYHNSKVPKQDQNQLDHLNNIEANTKLVAGANQYGKFILQTWADVSSYVLPIGQSVKALNNIKYSEGNKIIKSALEDGIIRIAEAADDIAMMKIRGQKASVMILEGGKYEMSFLPGEINRISLMEESLHIQQYKKYGEKFVNENLFKLEIQAQDKLLKIGKKEGWSDAAMNEIKKAKGMWEGLQKANKKK
jgi:RHS repeat-associated protein